MRILEFSEYLISRVGSQEQEQVLYNDKYNSYVETALLKIDTILELLEDLGNDLLKASINFSEVQEKIEYFKNLKREVQLEDMNTKHTKNK